jgi:hypothetical protein
MSSLHGEWGTRYQSVDPLQGVAACRWQGVLTLAASTKYPLPEARIVKLPFGESDYDAGPPCASHLSPFFPSSSTDSIALVHTTAAPLGLEMGREICFGLLGS